MANPDGADILFIHGMWGTPKVWENFAPAFEAAGYVCECLRLPFHDTLISETPNPNIGTASLRDYVDFVVARVSKTDTPPILVGHSMGGLIAQMVAAEVELAGVIALTPAPPAGVFALRPSTMRIFKNILLTPKFWKKPTCLGYKAARYGLLHTLSEADARAHYKDMVWESGRATFEIAFWTLDKSKAARLNRDKIRCPVLLVSGGQDRIVPTGVVKASARRYKGRCDTICFEDHSHWLIGEAGYGQVADACIDWLSKRVSGMSG